MSIPAKTLKVALMVAAMLPQVALAIEPTPPNAASLISRIGANEVFSNVCVDSRLDGKLFDVLARMFAEQRDLDLKELPIDLVKATSPDYKKGWGLSSGQSVIWAMYGEKPDGTATSRRCTVGERELTFDQGKKLISENYRVKLIEEFRQGTSRFALYWADLYGFGNMRLGIMVQADDMAPGVMLALYEIPG